MQALFGPRTWKDIPYESIPQSRWPSRILWHAQRLMDEAKEERRRQRKAKEPVTVQLLHPDQAYQLACNLVKDEALGIQALPLGQGLA